jgi:type IX secretion system PorP/SprF family membrane protein
MKRWAFLLFLVLLAIICTGQDPQFSRFYSNALYMAPSFAGSTGQNRFAASYRNQWPSIDKGYETYTASFDHDFSKLNSGVGILFMRDVAGSGNLSTTDIGILYSYDFRIRNTLHLRPGIHFMYTERSIDFNKLVWRDQMSAVGNAPASGEVVSNDKVGALDFAASGLIYNESFWFGGAADHLLHPNQSLYDQEYSTDHKALVPLKIQVFGGLKLVVKEQLLRPTPTVLQLAFLYKNQAGDNQLDIGFYWNYDPLVLGIWYRGIPIMEHNSINDAVILLVGYKTREFNIGYSYDFTTSHLMTSSGGAHEVSFSYTFSSPVHKKISKKMVPCPEF